MKKSLVIDQDLCSGHGRCYSILPHLFDCDDDGFGVVRGDATFDSGTGAQAIATCPERAISLIEK